MHTCSIDTSRNLQRNMTHIMMSLTNNIVTWVDITVEVDWLPRLHGEVPGLRGPRPRPGGVGEQADTQHHQTRPHHSGSTMSWFRIIQDPISARRLSSPGRRGQINIWKIGSEFIYLAVWKTSESLRDVGSISMMWMEVFEENILQMLFLSEYMDNLRVW